MSSLLSLIYKKRDGQMLDEDEIQFWIDALTDKENPAPDYQTAALLAFIYQKGMSEGEIAALTNSMRMSGTQFDYKGFPRGARFVDKHSTGGVGDKITLPLAALTVACHDKIYFPTISGRGLGHTGGTIDKLESIPGFKPETKISNFYKILKKHRACFLQQSSEIVPADRVLYALRDVTGTVESIPLITGSILSKKFSESLDFLILDIKYGNGAFLSRLDQTEQLSGTLIDVCTASKVQANVFQTRMDTPLGDYSGNRLEVSESLAILRNEGPDSSTELTKKFTQRFLVFMGLDQEYAHEVINQALKSGAALKVFENLVEAHGGSLAKFEKAAKNSRAKTKVLRASQDGYLHFDVRKLGLALVELGGGRKTKADKIDFDVGFYHPYETGDHVEQGQEVLRVYYTDLRKLENCLKLLNAAVQIREEPFQKSPLIRKILAT